MEKKLRSTSCCSNKVLKFAEIRPKIKYKKQQKSRKFKKKKLD